MVALKPKQIAVASPSQQNEELTHTRTGNFPINTLKDMKLYLVKISPCCRIVWLYCLQNKIPIEIHDVDVFSGKVFFIKRNHYYKILLKSLSTLKSNVILAKPS